MSAERHEKQAYGQKSNKSVSFLHCQQKLRAFIAWHSHVRKSGRHVTFRRVTVQSRSQTPSSSGEKVWCISSTFGISWAFAIYDCRGIVM